MNDNGMEWKCDKWQEYSWIVLEMPQHTIDLIEISNASSAFVEVFVSNSAEDNFRVSVGCN